LPNRETFAADRKRPFLTRLFLPAPGVICSHR
jgi:hypothetical protein